MSKKQLAVEWLIEQLYSHQGHIDILDVANINGYFDKALEMEKQEIKDTFYDGRTWNNSWNEETYFVEVYEKNGRYL